MAQNKIIIWILSIITILSIGTAIIVGVFWAHNVDEMTEMKIQYNEMAALVQTDEQALLVLTDWYEADGYKDANSWWTDYNLYKYMLYDIKSKTQNNEFASYITDEQWAKIEEIEKRANETHSITELKELDLEYNQIILNAQEKEKETKQTVVPSETATTETISYAASSNSYDPYGFKSAGVIYENGITYTWYSQNVLPGGGLNIPGRHVGENNFIYDGNGNIAVASSDYEYGTMVDTPFGTGVVYDSGASSGIIDIYTNF